ncbi:MAG: hypothetical protein DRQ54_03120 [Gammaproteobacteria bacterium]|nr:MAG: hypothetical protein DRQ54_03120 [Gammaproteobacteria bacterium]
MISKITLLRLFQLRSLAIAGQLVAILVAQFWLGLDLPLVANFSVIGGLTLINLLLWWQIRLATINPQWLIFGHLLADIVGLTLLLYLNGGYSNPFSALYLLPLAMAAALIPVAQVWMLAGLAVAGYTLNMLFYQPLPHYHGPFGDQFHLHLVGMWLGFVIGAGVIAYFLAGMGRELRRQQQALTQARMLVARREQVAALGALAASAAHELGTPLSTIKVLVGELLETAGGEPQQNLQLIKSQVDRCSRALGEIRFAVEGDGPVDDNEGIGLAELATLLQRAIDEWSVFSPQVRVEFFGDFTAPVSPSARRAEESKVSMAAVDALKRGLITVLDNSADAGADNVRAEYLHGDGRVVLRLMDDGEGIASQVIDNIGEPYVTTRGRGRGLGLYLVSYMLDSLGGSLQLTNSVNRGAVAELTIMLHAGLTPTLRDQA